MSEMAETNKDSNRFNRQFDRLERNSPRPLGLILRILRHPLAMIIRIPLGILLVIGGVFSILPVLGIWMLPLGLLLLAVDLPFLRGPTASGIIRLRRWWDTRKSRKKKRD